MKNMKAQAATEYLITYGWAIVIILAIMTVLYSTIFKPEFYVAERCDMAPGVVCDNFKLTPVGGQLQLELQMHNTLGFPMRPDNIELTVKDPQKGSEDSYILSGGVGIYYTGDSVRDGETLAIIHAFPSDSLPPSGTLYRIKFAMNYTNAITSTHHRTAGVVNVRTAG